MSDLATVLFPVHECKNQAVNAFICVFRMKKKENERDEDAREEDREPRERRCFQCGDMGHVRRDCPDYKHLRQRAAPGSGTVIAFKLH